MGMLVGVAVAVVAVGLLGVLVGNAAAASTSGNRTQGYWEVTSGGDIYSFGSAPFYGSAGNLTLAQPIVSMAAVPGGGGYWLVASDGGVFSYGDATFHGSVPGLPASSQPTAPVVGLVPSADGQGYWEVTAAGDVYSFGSAPFYGSAGNLTLAQPIVAMAAVPGGGGYWLVGRDGGVFSYGDASYYGSVPGLPASQRPSTPVVGFVPAKTTSNPTPTPTPTPTSTPTSTPLSIATTSLPNATAGQPYSFTLQASGGTPPYSWTVTSGSLPVGLVLATSGIVSGTPTSGGTTTFSVTVTDASSPPQSNTAILSIAVAAPQLAITTTSLPTVSQTIDPTTEQPIYRAYTAQLTAAGGTGPYSWSLTSGSLPVGLTLDSTGQIAGTPVLSGTYTFSVEVSDSSTPVQTAIGTLSITDPTLQSDNWSGYVAVGTGINGVEGTFTVPKLTTASEAGEQLAEWVGIDGWDDSSLIQAGITEYPDPNDPTGAFYILPWWEILPAPETPITTMTVSPGDQVTVTIGQVSGDEWAIELEDDTTGARFLIDETYTGPMQSAEWITEAPTDGSTGTIYPLAPYSPPATFSNLLLGGTLTGFADIEMVQGGYIVSIPSSPITNNGFTVGYGSQPAPP